MDDGAPGLSVGFQIDTGGSFASLAQLEGAMDAAEARVTRDAALIERATGNMVQLGGAVAQVQTFANALDRATHTAEREFARVEKAGEKLVFSLERQNAMFGKSRSELRQMRAEEQALAAERVGNSDLARRIREQEAALYDKEFAAARRVRQEADAAAEDKAAAAAVAEAAAAREEQALRSAAAAYQMFNAVARQKMDAYKAEQAAAERIEREAVAVRERTAAERAEINVLAERANIQAALERTTGVGRVRATDSGATFSALAARAADEEAAAQARLAAATRQAADEHARLADMVRNSHAAQVADAAAAERLRASTDPLYAATKRLNDEIAESTRLYYAGATAPDEYARQQMVLADRLRDVEKAHTAATGGIGKAGGAAKLATHDMLNLGFQIQDLGIQMLAAAGSSNPLKLGFTALVQQGSQIGQIAATSGVGVRGMASSMWALVAPFAPFAAGAAVALGAFALFDRAVSKGVDTKAMIDGLGLTRAEVKRLENTSVTSGDVIKATFQVVAERVGIDLSSMKGWFGGAMDFMTRVGRDALAGLYAGFVGTFDAIGIVVRNIRDGRFGETLGDIDKNMAKRFDQARGALNRFGADVTKQIGSNKLADLRKQADELKKDRTPEKPKVDRHAEQLAREAEAIAAQIKNLYALADAYGASGAAALIAEARVKAESKAIKQRADIEAVVAREVQLAVAQRVADAAKGTAQMREQAALQEAVNREVAAGNVPAERAAELLRDRLADLPLLAALEAARQVKDTRGAAAAAKALDEQRAARERLTDAEVAARIAAKKAAGDDRLAELREEIRLIGATEAARIRALATLRATQQASRDNMNGIDAANWIDQQVKIADAEYQLKLQTDAANSSLSYQADLLDIIADNAASAARGMADAFGEAGRAIGDTAAILSAYVADQKRLTVARDADLKLASQIGSVEQRIRVEREINTKFGLRSSALQIGAYGDMADAAQGFFKEGSAGYKALGAAEKAFRVAQFAMSLQAMVQNAAETLGFVTASAARATAAGAEGVANQSKLPFPANIAAMAATAAALVAAGVAVFGGGGGGSAPKTNTGTGTVLGDPDAKSESVRRALDALREVDLLMLGSSREMAASLRSIDSQIGGVAALVVRSGDINASTGVAEGFKPNLIGSVLSNIPLIGGLLGGLFGSKTTVQASGLYGGAQSLASVLNGGFDASYYSDIKKQSSFLGIKTGTKYSTQYTGADAGLESQFTLILRDFNNAIVAAAGPLGAATADIQSRLNSFVVNIGKIDLQNLTGAEIQEKLTAVFGAAADRMAGAAFPGFERFQRVGEGLFETVVRVSSTVEAVSASLDQLGSSARTLGIDAKLGLADQFDSISDLTSAIDGYFTAFYTPAEQNAAKLSQLGNVFVRLGVAMPDTLASFRSLVEAQDLNTAAGRATYATLLQLAPAFADLKASMEGAKSAADVLAERQDLQRQILELSGDTAALRALDLAKLDASNRALQEQVWAMQDAQEAARAADDLRKAWQDVGTSIEEEIRRIRGLNDPAGTGGFAALQGQFNAQSALARAGDQEAAKLLPGLSQALLKAAADSATSRQELDRVQAQTAASLELTFAAIQRFGAAATAAGSAEKMAAAMALAPASSNSAAPANDMAAEIRTLREEVAGMRRDNNAGHASTAGNTSRIATKLDDVTADSGGNAVSTVAAA